MPKTPKTLECLEQDVDGLYNVSSAFSKRLSLMERELAALKRRETWLMLLLILLCILTVGVKLRGL